MHPYLDVMTVTEVKIIPKSVCNRTQSRKAIKRRTICLTDSDHDYTIYKIKHRDTIKYEKKMSVYDSFE